MSENYTIHIAPFYRKNAWAYGDWLVRVYFGDKHIHSAEGGVSLQAAVREAEQAIEEHDRGRT